MPKTVQTAPLCTRTGVVLRLMVGCRGEMLHGQLMYKLSVFGQMLSNSSHFHGKLIHIFCNLGMSKPVQTVHKLMKALQTCIYTSL